MLINFRLKGTVKFLSSKFKEVLNDKLSKKRFYLIVWTLLYQKNILK